MTGYRVKHSAEVSIGLLQARGVPLARINEKTLGMYETAKDIPAEPEGWARDVEEA